MNFMCFVSLTLHNQIHDYIIDKTDYTLVEELKDYDTVSRQYKHFISEHHSGVTNKKTLLCVFAK